MGTGERRRRRRRRPPGGWRWWWAVLAGTAPEREEPLVSRTYRVGYKIVLSIERTADGPSGRLFLREEAHGVPLEIGGLLSYDVLGDVEALAFAILHELRIDPQAPDPF